VQGFVDVGEPISSGWLYQRHDFGIKPAMIRHELDKLSEEGFLDQPHHSAGRMPTDSGYEFFAERVMEKLENSPPSPARTRFFFEKKAWPSFLEDFSSELHLLGVAQEEGSIYKSGIDRLVECISRDAPEEVKVVVQDFVKIDKRLERLEEILCAYGEPQVFIGRKSPITRCESLAVIAGSYG